MRVYIVVFRFGSRTFARAFSVRNAADSYALRVKVTLGVLADVIPTTLDAYDPTDKSLTNGDSR